MSLEFTSKYLSRLSSSEDAAYLIDNEELDEDLESTSIPESVTFLLDTNDESDVQRPKKTNTFKRGNDSQKEAESEPRDLLGNDSQKEARRTSRELFLRVPLDLTKYLIKGKRPNGDQDSETANENVLHDSFTTNASSATDETRALQLFYNDSFAMVDEQASSCNTGDGHVPQRHENTQQEFKLGTPRNIRDIQHRRRKIQQLQAISFFAVLVFFPLGIPAVYFANKIEPAFNKGIILGNIDRSIQLLKRTEKLIVCSFVAAFITTLIVLIVLEIMVSNDAF